MNVKGKKILVFGSGISGIGAAGLLEDRGAVVTLYDGNDKLDKEVLRNKISVDSKAEIVLGEFPEELYDRLDMMVISPGVPTDLPVVNKIRDKGIAIIGEKVMVRKSVIPCCD